MRAHVEHAADYIRSLAASIDRDPASLDSWRCVHIHPESPDRVDMTTLYKVQEWHKDTDCDVVLCADGDALIISRSQQGLMLQHVVELLTGQMHAAPELMHYDLFRDWRVMRALLANKADGLERKGEQISHPTLMPHDGLRVRFSEVKASRAARAVRSVMVVDDDPLTRRMVVGAFKERYALLNAGDAEEAITNYLLHAPDIVFLDIGLPNISGFAVLNEIMAIDPDAYVVMLSGNDYLDNVTKALTEGAMGFVAKPFVKEKLRHYIEDGVMHHQQGHAL